MFKFYKSRQPEGIVYRNTSAALAEESVRAYDELKSDNNVVRFPLLLTESNTPTFNSYSILNNYIETKDNEWKDKLFNMYQRAHKDTDLYANKTGPDADVYWTKVVRTIHNIIDHINYDELLEYITNINPIPVPNKLKTTFNEQIEIDGTGTRDQTYIVSDYIKLIALLGILKAVYLPISKLMNSKDDRHKRILELQMLDILRLHNIYATDPFVKLVRFCTVTLEKILESPNINPDIIRVKLFSYQIASEEIPIYFMCLMLWGPCIQADLYDSVNVHDSDIVSHIYRSICNKLKNPEKLGNAIRDNNIGKKSGIGEDQDKESVFESYRSGSDLTRGDVASYDLTVETTDEIMRQLLVVNKEKYSKVKKEDIDFAINVLDTRMSPDDISDTHVAILGIIFKKILDPRTSMHVSLTGMRNQLAVGYAICKALDLEYMASLLLSKRIEQSETESSFSINVDLSTAKAKGHREEELLALYPYRRLIKSKNKTTDGNYIILDYVSNLTSTIRKYKWIPTVGKIPTGGDIKKSIIDFLISIQA